MATQKQQQQQEAAQQEELALGLDLSTQSVTCVVVDTGSRRTLWSRSLPYLSDARLGARHLPAGSVLLAPGEPGEANQPAALFLDALDAALADARDALGPGRMARIASVGVSAQQHAHAFLGAEAPRCFEALQADGCEGRTLAQALAPAFVFSWMRIWMTACTAPDSESVSEAAGGVDEMLRITGSDAPARFSAFGIRRTARQHPAEYAAARRIHHLSSLVTAVLTARADAPLDFGEACGSSLMDYTARAWSPRVAEAVAHDLPGGAQALLQKLPELVSPESVVGRVAPYFVRKYGLSAECVVSAGSGDNPQTKVLVPGSALSLGSSYVLMAECATSQRVRGANCMYDGLGRPFAFCCRTNGALCWDNVRQMHGNVSYEAADATLAAHAPSAGAILLWHRVAESFPRSAAVGPVRVGYDKPDFARDYCGAVDATLASLYLHSRQLGAAGDALYVCGGVSHSRAVAERVAALWRKPVVPFETGAALGAAVSAAWASRPQERRGEGAAVFASSFVARGESVAPREDLVQAYHSDNGFLKAFEAAEAQHLRPLA
eukprot:m51a1_g8016 putative D-xylulose kinase (551) ;mRNA; r:193627-195335